MKLLYEGDTPLKLRRSRRLVAKEVLLEAVGAVMFAVSLYGLVVLAFAW